MRTTGMARGALMGLMVAAGTLGVFCGASFAADTGESAAVLGRIERLERELRDLERDYYRGRAPASSSSTGGAVMSGGEDSSLSERMTSLEDSLRALTGEVEQLNFRQSQLDNRLAGVEAANGIKPPPAMSGDAGPSAGQPTVLGSAAPGGDTAPAPTGEAPAPGTPPGTPSQNAPPNKGVETLGSFSSGSTGAPPPAAPAGDENAQFAAAVDILYRGDNESGAAALQSFVSQHPKSPKVGEAYYWLGEAQLAQKAYREAAQAFLTTVQKYPKDAKAPQALVKLGVTLIQGGQKTEGCKQLKTVKSVFPKAGQNVLDMATRERARAGCA